jgi:hypothetical protein
MKRDVRIKCDIGTIVDSVMMLRSLVGVRVSRTSSFIVCCGSEDEAKEIVKGLIISDIECSRCYDLVTVCFR